jgi:hypothetical protein
MTYSFVATRGQNSRAAGDSIAGAIYRFNDHQHGSSTPHPARQANAEYRIGADRDRN